MSQNGKGSARRTQTKEELKRYEENYEAIFGKSKKKKRSKVIVEKVEIIPMPPEHQKLADELMEAVRKLRNSESSEQV